MPNNPKTSLLPVNSGGEETLRVLMCSHCHTIEELPPYDGPKRPDGSYDDAMLDRLMAEHNKRHGTPSGMDMSVFEFFNVAESRWHDPVSRDEIFEEQKRRRGGGTTGFSPELYATVSTFEDDALKCFVRHNSPPEGCIDWHEDSKLLTPESWRTDDVMAELTTKERSYFQESKAGRRKVFLCDYCPVSSYMNMRRRQEMGLYK